MINNSVHKMLGGNLAIYLAAAIVWMCCGCSSSPTENQQITGITTPVVTGLHLIRSNGFWLGTWENPADEFIHYQDMIVSGIASPPLPPFTEFVFESPYPNPGDDQILLQYILVEKSEVEIWLVHAQSTDAMRTNGSAAGGAIVAPAQGVRAATLARTLQSAGIYSQLLDAKALPPGFYRVYIRANGIIRWHDILVYHSFGDLPPVLQSILSYPTS